MHLPPQREPATGEHGRAAAPPVVSIVIPTQHRAALLRVALDSIESQTWKGYEVVVVQNGPDRSSWDVVREYQNRGLPISYHVEARAHPVHARNAGIRLARGRYVAFLEDDDWWMPHKLELQHALAERRPDVGLVSCRSIMVDEVLGQRSERPPIARRCDFAALVGDECGELISSLSGVLVRRQCFDDLGLFDPRYPVSSDVDFYIRLARRYQIASIDEPLFFYRWHGANLSANGVQGRLDMIRILRRTRPSPDDGVDAAFIAASLARYRVRLCRVSEYLMTRHQWAQAARGFAAAVRYEPFIGRRLELPGARSWVSRILRPYRLMLGTARRAALAGMKGMGSGSAGRGHT